MIKAIVIFRNMFLFLGRQAPKEQDSSNNEIISTIDRWLKNDGVIGAQRPQCTTYRDLGQSIAVEIIG